MPESLMEPEFEKLADRVCALDYAFELYAALCNVPWKHLETGDTFSCTWRTAGAIVADIRDRGECYLDFYCGGNEGEVTPRIRKDMERLGWRPMFGEEAADYYGLPSL
jgi:hypothetical protein